MNHRFQRATTGSIAEDETLPPGPDASVREAIVAWLAAAGRGGNLRGEGA